MTTDTTTKKKDTDPLGINASRYTLRTDHTAPSVDLDALAQVNIHDPATRRAGTFATVLALCANHWMGTAIPTIGLQSAIDTLGGFLHTVALAGAGTIHQITTEQINDYINNAPPSPRTNGVVPNDIKHLRRNVIAALTKTLEAHRIPHPHTWTVPVLTEPKLSRCATHDEMLILRLAAPHTTQRAHSLSAAVLAVITSGANSSEAPTIEATHVDITNQRLQLSGLRAARTARTIEPRTVALDDWATKVLAEFLEYGHDRRIAQLLYTGRHALTSTSAQASIDNQFKNARDRAGLSKVGLTCSAARLWGALRDATTQDDLETAADTYGTHWTILHHHMNPARGNRLIPLCD